MVTRELLPLHFGGSGGLCAPRWLCAHRLLRVLLWDVIVVASTHNSNHILWWGFNGWWVWGGWACGALSLTTQGVEGVGDRDLGNMRMSRDRSFGQIMRAFESRIGKTNKNQKCVNSTSVKVKKISMNSFLRKIFYLIHLGNDFVHFLI